MKTKLLQLLFLCVSSIYATHIQAQNLTWAKTMVASSSASSFSTSITTDATGNIYTTGFFGGTVDFDPNAGIFNMTAPALHPFISKLDASGNFVWAKMIAAIPSAGNLLTSGAYSVKIDGTGNVYITGFFTGMNVDFDPSVGVYSLSSSMSVEDIFILKLDASGNFVWARNMGGSGYDRAYSIAVDATGNVYTTGIFDQTADFDPGAGVFNLTPDAAATDNNDIFVSKLNSAGNFVWAKKLGGSRDDQSSSIAVDAAGSVYTTGFFTGTADFDPSVNVGNITAAGGPTGKNMFVSKLDASGNYVWVASIYEPYTPGRYSLALGGTNSMYVAANSIYKLNRTTGMTIRHIS